MIRNIAILLGGGLAGKLLKLLRSVILARLLSIEHYGIVATFGLTMSMMEMLSALSLDRMAVQDRDGDTQRFQGTLHSLQLLRGLVTALLMFVFAGLYAQMMGVDVVWPYQLLAVSPLIGGLVHFDVHRQQRKSRFGTHTLWLLSNSVVALMVMLFLMLFMQDWRLGLFPILAGQAGSCILTHVMAERRYVLAWDPQVVRRAVHFGWPLLINAILLFVILNGERIIVSNQLGLEALAIFSLTYGLTQIPSALLNKAHAYLFLPSLSKNQGDPARFASGFVLAMQSGLALALVLAVMLSIVGGDLMILIYGEKYSIAAGLMVWMAIYQSARLMRAGLSVAAVSKAMTRLPMQSNFVRVASLPVALGAVLLGADLEMLVMIAIAAELLVYGYGLYLTRQVVGPIPRPVLMATASTLAVYGLLVLDIMLVPRAPQIGANYHAGQVVLLVAGVAAVLSMAAFRTWVLRQMQGILAKLKRGPST